MRNPGFYKSTHITKIILHFCNHKKGVQRLKILIHFFYSKVVFFLLATDLFLKKNIKDFLSKKGSFRLATKLQPIIITAKLSTQTKERVGFYNYFSCKNQSLTWRGMGLEGITRDYTFTFVLDGEHIWGSRGSCPTEIFLFVQDRP